MNELIRKLAEQATKVHVSDGWNTCEDVEVFDQLKFAELIVQEYEKLLPETCPWINADKDGPMKGWHVQFVARKLFGIES